MGWICQQKPEGELQERIVEFEESNAMLRGETVRFVIVFIPFMWLIYSLLKY